MAGLRVAIIGGGIGGLSAAVALRQRGVREVRVYEQAPALGQVGAGLMVQANSLRVLARLGVFDRLARAAERMTEWRQSRADGTVISQETFSTGPGNMFFGIHRADLLDALVAMLPEDVVHTGYQCVGFEEDDRRAVVRFANGVSVDADVVIAADGIHSTLQRYVVQPSEPVFSGAMAYRGTLPARRVPEWPAGTIRFWSGGQGRYLLAYRVRRGELLNFVAFMPADEEMRESWSAPGDPATLAAAYADWDPFLGKILSEVETTFRSGIYDREPLPRWSRGRLTLLGDAAHASLPHMGQGSNQAIEDAMGLATLLKDASAEDAPRALISYERLRLDRTTQVQRGSRMNASRSENAEAYKLGLDWLYDYDVEKEALALR
jgi:salicylate hydroxylase